MTDLTDKVARAMVIAHERLWRNKATHDEKLNAMSQAAIAIVLEESAGVAIWWRDRCEGDSFSITNAIANDILGLGDD